MVGATISGMTTAEPEIPQSAYDRLGTSETMPPNYLVAILLAAIPRFTDETPLHCEAIRNDDSSVTWSIVVADGQRLVRIEVTGPASEYGRPYGTRPQAVSQQTTITPITGSVTKVEATTSDTTRRPDKGIQWQTTWTIHFADGSVLTVPTDEQARHHHDRERIDQFVQSFLELALPR